MGQYIPFHSSSRASRSGQNRPPCEAPCSTYIYIYIYIYDIYTAVRIYRGCDVAAVVVVVVVMRKSTNVIAVACFRGQMAKIKRQVHIRSIKISYWCIWHGHFSEAVCQTVGEGLQGKTNPCRTFGKCFCRLARKTKTKRHFGQVAAGRIWFQHVS